MHPLDSLIGLPELELVEKDIVPSTPPPLPKHSELFAPVEVETYVYCMPLSTVNAELWSFDDFVKNNAWKWVGKTPGSEASRESYTEVEKRREKMEAESRG